MKLKGFLFWFYLAVICDLFVLYGWIKEIEWMIPTFLIASIIFATSAVVIESDNIKIINNLWDDLDNLKNKVSNLKDKIDNLWLDNAKKQDEAETIDKYITETYDPQTGKVRLDFDTPICPYANTIIKFKGKDDEK